jgi:periplasmic protein TonB
MAKGSFQIQEEEPNSEQEPMSLPEPPSTFPPLNVDIESPFSDQAYRRRMSASVGFSVLLNFLFLWLLLTTNISNFRLSPEKPKPKPKTEAPRLVLIQKPQPPAPKEERSKTFLEVDPNQASTKTPENAKFYSEKSTLAGQKEETEIKSTDIPKLDGKNIKTMALETVTSQKIPNPPAVETPKPEPEKTAKPQAAEKTKPAPAPPSPMEVALLKPQKPMEETESDKKEIDTSKKQGAPSNKSLPPVPPTPQSQKVVPNAQSKLSGGVKGGKAIGFNSAESPFAPYDKKIIAKIGAYWQYQLEKYYGEKIGEVEISFKLLADGRISDLRVTKNTANLVLAGWCIQAIERSAPFEPFPPSMMAMVGSSREASITFAY